MSICDAALGPLTLAQATDAMQRWLMRGGFAMYSANGKFQLTATFDPPLNMLAQRMVLSGYGIRLARGIELNATGLALWQAVHP